MSYSCSVTFWNDEMIYSDTFESFDDAYASIKLWMSEHISDMPASLIGWKLYNTEHTLIDTNLENIPL